MVKKIKLTDDIVASLPVPAKGQVFHWCAKERGLAVRITAAGSRAYIAQGQVQGKTVRVTLGRCDQLSVDDARIQCHAALLLMRQGTSPVERKKQVKIEGVTLQEALEDYLQHRRSAYGPLRESTKEKLRGHVEHNLADWRSKPMTSITHLMVAQRFREISELAPVQANIVMGTLRSLFSWVRDKSINAEGIPTICAHNPVVIAFRQLVKYNHVKPRTRRVPTDRTGAVWHLLEQRLDADRFTPNDNHNAALALSLMIVGARFSELATLKWTAVHLDDEKPYIEFTETKQHRRLMLPITTTLNRLLSLQWERRQSGNPYVFVGRTRKSHVKILYKTLHHVGDIAGGKISAHDFRRGLVQAGETVGIQSHIVELLTGHAPTGVTAKHYRDSEDLRHYLPQAQAIADWFEQQGAIYAAQQSGANVVGMPARA
jgi:integrase